LDYIGFNGSATSFNLLADLRFKDADGSHYVGFQSPSTVGTNLVWTLPASDGSASHVLKTAGDGTLSFGEIVNASVASNAAIAGTKISPDFGSQNIVTTGGFTVAGDVLFDSTSGSDYDIQWTASTGQLKIKDSSKLVFGTNGDVSVYHDDSDFTLSNSKGNTFLQGTGDVYIRTNNTENALKAIQNGAVELYHDSTKKIETTSGGVSVTGNIVVSGTVDGVDIATRDTLFGGLTASSGVLTDGVSATTQTASDNTTKVATTAYVTTAVNNLINGAPAALDTLNELAAAMNDDAAFSTTVTNNLATKLALAGGQMTGNITFSGSQTVDGRDLSVDGAKLDGGIMLADGDKGDITVSNSGATFTIDNDAVTSAKIADNNVTTSEIADDAVTSAKIMDGTIIAGNLADEAVQTLKIADNSVTSAKITNGTILNIDVNASAAIAGTKISPDFGSQAISTTGALGCGDITISDITPAINFTDSDDNPDYQIRLNSGILKFTDTTNSADRIQINSDGHVDVLGNLDVGSGLDVTGNITVTGTVDGVDIATRDTLFGGLTASSGVLTDGVTATSQSATDNTTKVATTAFTQSAISNATITGSQISTNAISTNKIADSAVTTDKIADDAIDADKLASNSVVSASIVDGAIVNADINASAAIAGTKIDPDFGAQNIQTNGTLSINNISTGGSITILNSTPKLNFNDTSDNPDYQINIDSGVFNIRDTTNSVNRLVINTDGHVDVAGNLDVGAGLDVTGAITATGNLTITNSFPKIDLVKDSTSYQINNENGVFNIKQGGGANKIQINTDGHVDITANLDAEGGIDVTGDITVTGTVDGVDIAALNSTVSGKLSNIVEDTSPQLGGDLDMNSKFISSGILGIKNTGSQSQLQLYCESSNAHYAAIQAPAHSDFLSGSGNVTLTLPAVAGNQSLVGTTETQTLTNKTLTSAVLNTGVSGSAILDEDDMASNSATQLATQQSIKAYVDANAGGGGGSPGGSNTQVQFNNSGSFGGSSNLTFDGTNLAVGGTVSGTSSASGTAGFRKITASTSAPTSSDGADGDVWIKYTA